MEDTQSTDSKLSEEKKYQLKGAFLTTIGLVAAGIGFARTIATAKKNDPKYFSRGMTGTIEMADTGANLAMRALGWGTLYAFAGTGAICFGIWKWSGATNMKEFRERLGSILPRLTKNEPPRSRTEFEGLNDLLHYLSTWTKD